MVAQQILSILSALAASSERFVFEGREIMLVWSCGIFITMNPGKFVSVAFWVICPYQLSLIKNISFDGMVFDKLTIAL